MTSKPYWHWNGRMRFNRLNQPPYAYRCMDRIHFWKELPEAVENLAWRLSEWGSGKYDTNDL